MSPHCLLRRVGVALLALAMSCAGAQAATRYGEDFVRLGGDWSEVSSWWSPPPDPLAAEQNAADHLPRLEEQLQARELAAGPYAPTLAEPLIDLGSLYRRAGDLDKSRQVYQRALHVVRINQGLYSDQQLPLLRQLLAVDRQRGDWQSLDQRYDYYLRASSMTDADDHAPLLEYLRWQRQALRLEVDAREDERLLRLLSLNGELLERGGNLDAARYWPLLESQLHNLYLLQAWQAPVVLQQEMGLRRSAFAQPAMELSAREQRLVNLQRVAVSEGVALLEQFLSRGDLEDVELTARVRLALADWEQWNGRQHSALARYSSLIAWLQSRGRSDLNAAWFAEPVELPDNGVFWRPPEEDGQRIRADYSVSPEGRARAVDTRAGDESGRGHAIRLYRQLLSTRFRPAFSGGPEPLSVEGVERSYLVSARR